MIPKQVKVGGLNYKVVEKEFVEISGDRNYNGSCDYGRTTIELVEDMSNSRKEEVFVHELTHAIFESAGYNEQDEDMINRVGKVLYQVFKDNKFNFGDEKEKLKFYDGQ